MAHQLRHSTPEEQTAGLRRHIQINVAKQPEEEENLDERNINYNKEIQHIASTVHHLLGGGEYVRSKSCSTTQVSSRCLTSAAGQPQVCLPYSVLLCT